MKRHIKLYNVFTMIRAIAEMRRATSLQCAVVAAMGTVPQGRHFISGRDHFGGGQGTVASQREQQTPTGLRRRGNGINAFATVGALRATPVPMQGTPLPMQGTPVPMQRTPLPSQGRQQTLFPAGKP
ncbi:MAG: hypothetical protein LBR08_05580 [Bacteroidales bacterium]|nr:hypothetical protein [Bacteroidales bacterium]